MQIQNSFEIPLPPDKAWDVLMDIPKIAPCMPGADLTGSTPDGGYQGLVSVKLGPVALSFNGTAHFAERDDAEKRAVVSAQGADRKGRGNASAVVEFRLSSSGAGSRVDIRTEMNLSGLVAQYGRGAGLIQAVAEQLVSQFAKNLRTMIAGQSGQTAPVTGGDPSVAKPIGGVSLIFSVIWQSIRRLWSR